MNDSLDQVPSLEDRGGALRAAREVVDARKQLLEARRLETRIGYKDGMVHMLFHTPTEGIEMDPHEATRIARALMSAARKALRE